MGTKPPSWASYHDAQRLRRSLFDARRARGVLRPPLRTTVILLPEHVPTGTVAGRERQRSFPEIEKMSFPVRIGGRCGERLPMQKQPRVDTSEGLEKKEYAIAVCMDANVKDRLPPAGSQPTICIPGSCVALLGLAKPCATITGFHRVLFCSEEKRAPTHARARRPVDDNIEYSEAFVRVLLVTGHKAKSDTDSGNTELAEPRAGPLVLRCR